MRLFSIIFSMLVVSSSAMGAERIVCEHDGRPYDGTYNQVSVELNDQGSYDVILNTAWAGFLGQGEARHVLAKNLSRVEIVEDRLIASGHKSSSEEGESSNSGFSFTRVREAKVNAWTGEVSEEEYIDVVVYSPLIRELGEEVAAENGRLSFRFSIADQFSRGCFAE